MITSLIIGFVVTTVAIALYKAAERLNERERAWTMRLREDTERMRVRLNDSNGTVEHKVARDNGEFCAMLRKTRVAGGNPGDKLIEGLLEEIVGEKDCERLAAVERTRSYREAHCSQCGRKIEKK